MQEREGRKLAPWPLIFLNPGRPVFKVLLGHPSPYYLTDCFCDRGRKKRNAFLSVLGTILPAAVALLQDVTITKAGGGGSSGNQ